LTFNDNYDHLSKEWNDEVMRKFVEKIDNVVQNIVANPYLFPTHEYNRISAGQLLINELFYTIR